MAFVDNSSISNHFKVALQNTRFCVLLKVGHCGAVAWNPRVETDVDLALLSTTCMSQRSKNPSTGRPWGLDFRSKPPCGGKTHFFNHCDSVEIKHKAKTSNNMSLQFFLCHWLIDGFSMEWIHWPKAGQFSMMATPRNSEGHLCRS